MITKKHSFKLIYLILTILLVLSLNAVVKASEVAPDAKDTQDLEGIEELLAVDEEVEKEAEGGSGVKSSEADVLTKAQRIVIELNNDNTKRVIDDFEYVLVLGYAPWCSRSAELMPQFAEAATSLKELGIPLQMAKLDADRYPKPASLLGIKGFPTMLLFVNGSSQVYSGGFTADDIVIWMRKRIGTPVIRINSVAEAEEFLKKYHTFVIGLFDRFEGSDYEEFVKAAKSDNETQFVEVNKAELAKVLFPDLKHSDIFLGIVKREPERYTAYDGTFSMDKILEFLGYSKFLLVTRLTEMNSMRVYSSPVKLQSFKVQNVYVGEGSDFSGVPTKLMTVNGTLRMNINNPATYFGIHVHSKYINLVFSDIIVASGQLKKHYQPRKSHRVVSVNLEGNKVPLYGAGSRIKHSLTGAVEVSLTLKLEILSVGNVVGKLVRAKTHEQITCPLIIDSSTSKPIKFNKSSCSYI